MSDDFCYGEQSSVRRARNNFKLLITAVEVKYMRDAVAECHMAIWRFQKIIQQQQPKLKTKWKEKKMIIGTTHSKENSKYFRSQTNRLLMRTMRWKLFKLTL